METKRVADLTVAELQEIILKTKRVSDLTVEELKAVITEVVDLAVNLLAKFSQ